MNPLPLIDFVMVGMQQITIVPLNSGDFEYSIDGENYVSSSIFTLSEGGLYNAYIKDTYHCGVAILPFVFISVPPYFTPNNDGINDYWLVKGTPNYSNATTAIFDRYGKLITVLNNSSSGWDGTFKNEKLPANDYWFVTKIPETSQVIKGHFSLLR